MTTSTVHSLIFQTLGRTESENGNTRVKHRLRTGRLICTAWGLGAWLILFLTYYDFAGCFLSASLTSFPVVYSSALALKYDALHEKFTLW